jgi:Methyltransferase domain
MTEQFGEYDPNFPSFDQKVLFCRSCGHIQLQRIIEPKTLYTPTTYNYRIDNSKKIQAEYEFFFDFVTNLDINLKNLSVLELGAGNFQLANFFKKLVGRYTVCEPILLDLDGTSVNGVEVIGKFAEEAISDLDSLAPEFVFGRHFLEHVVNPKELLSKLLSNVKSIDIFCFEVPSLEHLREQSRFDAIIHDHVQYFDIHSVKNLISYLNCELLDYSYNTLGSNGGSLIFAFRKSTKSQENDENLEIIDAAERFRIENKEVTVKEEIANFLIGMRSLEKQIELSTVPIYGMGAAHMLATMNYHLGGKLELLDSILDDNYDLDGGHYKNIDLEIKHPSKVGSLKDAVFLITSQENRRTIISKLIQMGVSKILTTTVT